jgi:hypothetical protein
VDPSTQPQLAQGQAAIPAFGRFTAPSLALALDELMIVNNGGFLAAPHVPDGALRRRPGVDVAREIGGRHLLSYVHPARLGEFAAGTPRRVWVTPTPFDSQSVTVHLYLPDPGRPRKHVLLIDPSKIAVILGPRRVFLGHGIEYLLPDGFDPTALVSKWEMEIA